MIAAGDTVVEVGGHIGYLSLWFSRLVGPSGRVFVFEPGLNNLPYIRENLRGRGNVTLVEKGCGPRAEMLNFYEDNLTGQNNSFVKDFAGLEYNSRSALGVRVKVETHQAEVCRADDFMARHDRPVDFVKIDTEGYGWAVLRGCLGFLRQAAPPKFMVEVQADQAPILELFSQHGYHLFNASRQRVEVIDHMRGNLLALHPIHHSGAIKHWCSGAGESA